MKPLWSGILCAATLCGCTSIDRFPLVQPEPGHVNFERVVIPNVSRGGFPLGIAAGHLSGGERPDVAVTTWGSLGKEGLGGVGEGKVSVVLGMDANKRVLSTKDEYPVGLGASGIAIADLDGDGHLDLIVTATNGITGAGALSVQPGQVWIFYGTGKGTFSTPRIARSPTPFPVSVVVGDVDGDGYPDLVVGSPLARGITIFRGGPKGMLLPMTIPAGSTTQSIALGHFRTKETLDIAILGKKEPTASGEPVLTIWAGDGHGGFSQLFVPLESLSPDSYQSIAASDLAHGGLDDLVVHSREKLFVFKAHQGQVPSRLIAYRGQFLDGAVQIADFDGDGVPDILVPAAPDGLAILFGIGEGFFYRRVNLPLPAPLSSRAGQAPTDGIGAFFFGSTVKPSNQRWATAIVDFDNSGLPDILVPLSSPLLQPESAEEPGASQDSGTSLVIFRNRMRGDTTRH